MNLPNTTVKHNTTSRFQTYLEVEVSQLKLFPDDPPLFSIIQDKSITANALETDLK